MWTFQAVHISSVHQRSECMLLLQSPTSLFWRRLWFLFQKLLCLFGLHRRKMVRRKPFAEGPLPSLQNQNQNLLSNLRTFWPYAMFDVVKKFLVLQILRQVSLFGRRLSMVFRTQLCFLPGNGENLESQKYSNSKRSKIRLRKMHFVLLLWTGVQGHSC